MNSQIFTFVLAAFLAVQVSSANLLRPEVRLIQLKEKVQSSIRSAHNFFVDLDVHINSVATNRLREGEEKIFEHHGVAVGQLVLIKESNMGKDISQCKDEKENTIHRLPEIFMGRLQSCIGDKTSQAKRILQDYTYTVDVVANKVHELEYRLNKCQDITCRTDLANQIEQSLTSLPDNIRQQVNRVQENFSILGVAINTCSDFIIANLEGHISNLTNEIWECVRKL